MTRQPVPGVPASYNHARIIYSHIEIEPGAPLTLAAEPWSFFQAWLHERIGRQRGENRRCSERALYFVQIAEEFYRAAGETDLPSRATLAYYGVLHLVKAFLSLKGVDFESGYEQHGLSLGPSGAHSIQIQGRKNNANQVFHLFASNLKSPYPMKAEITLQEAASHVPEVHEMAFTLKHLPGTSRTMLPVRIQLFFNQAQDKMFSEVSYRLKHRERVPLDSFYTEDRKRYLKDGVEVDGDLVHRCARSKSFNWGNLSRIYKNVCAEYGKLNFASLLTPQGYRYYCDLASPRYHHLCYSFALLFYLGVVVRYRPTETKALLESSLRPLMTEALALIPNQMLYQVVSLSVGGVCVKPYAKV